MSVVPRIVCAARDLEPGLVLVDGPTGLMTVESVAAVDGGIRVRADAGGCTYQFFACCDDAFRTCGVAARRARSSAVVRGRWPLVQPAGSDLAAAAAAVGGHLDRLGGAAIGVLS
ncbi:hypothetical protein [Mycobacteroides chelonae]|uniref:hypothetical protein n=1 Tax=Mycobacteroides chelonae TaxID=1774 RepID=UPI00104255AE|nr:hypothetical protein [Mycobacteroides chelonae]